MTITWITINVRDFGASKAFYRDYLGLTAAREFSPHPAMSIAFFSDSNGMEIELICEKGAESSTVSNSGVSIGLRVSNYDALLQEARSRKILIGEPTSFGPGIECFFVNDPNGVGVQMIREMRAEG